MYLLFFRHKYEPVHGHWQLKPTRPQPPGGTSSSQQARAAMIAVQTSTGRGDSATQPPPCGCVSNARISESDQGLQTTFRGYSSMWSPTRTMVRIPLPTLTLPPKNWGSSTKSDMPKQAWPEDTAEKQEIDEVRPRALAHITSLPPCR